MTGKNRQENDFHWLFRTVDYRQIENSQRANQIHRFTKDYGNSTSSSVRVTTELHEKHAHAYLLIAVLLSGQSTRVLLHGTKILVFTTIIFILATFAVRLIRIIFGDRRL